MYASSHCVVSCCIAKWGIKFVHKTLIHFIYCIYYSSLLHTVIRGWVRHIKPSFFDHDLVPIFGGCYMPHAKSNQCPPVMLPQQTKALVRLYPSQN